LLVVVLLLGGCNLFSPFYDEGKAESLDDTIGDVQAALERGEPGKAYEYASKGIEKYPESVTLHYLGAVAKVQTAHINFTDFASMLRSEDGGGDFASALAQFGSSLGVDDSTFFRELSPEDLARMAAAFDTSYLFLKAAVDLIEDGEATPEELAEFGGDIYLGLGVSGLLKAMLTVLDVDHNLSNGFELHPTIRAYETVDGWGFTAILDPDVVCDAMPWLRVAQEALYDHYREVVGGDLPADIPDDYLFKPLDLWVDPWIDDGTLTGEFFANVHRGIVSFHDDYPCGAEVSRHE
jgi:hypothetical protein